MYCATSKRSFSSRAMWRRSSVAVMLGGFAGHNENFILPVLADPVFPGESSSDAATLSGEISTITHSASFKRSIGDQDTNLAKTVGEATKELSEAVANEMSLEALKKDAFVLVHLAARKQLMTGGCARDFEACPSGFEAAASGQPGFCAPDASYTGFCGPRNFASMSQAERDDWAWRCGASWPCKSVKASYDTPCPVGWTPSRDAGACQAPASYGGICSPTTSFVDWTLEEKAKWATLCGVMW
ncbi:unnamed protein product [Amoebophrya sp. A25]|nr:unnamed protein product [Amoebophrya sp. A25]|eukprot:GSA25T00020357001.1